MDAHSPPKKSVPNVDRPASASGLGLLVAAVVPALRPRDFLQDGWARFRSAVAAMVIADAVDGDQLRRINVAAGSMVQLQYFNVATLQYCAEGGIL